MRSPKLAFLLGLAAFFLLSPFSTASADVTLPMSNNWGLTDANVTVTISVSNPDTVAGAAFTVRYDNQELTFVGIQSDFFDTFEHQWAGLADPPDPLPPNSVVVDSQTYTQPLVTNPVEDGTTTDLMVAAARCTPATSSDDSLLFTLTFQLGPGGAAGTAYDVEIFATTLNNPDAGYTVDTDIPLIVGADLDVEDLTDPAAFPILLPAPSEHARVSVGTVTFWVGTSDDDQDGLTNAEELANNTDPNDSDSDGDGMNDGWEVQYLRNPLVDEGDADDDPDMDGASNLRESEFGTDPGDPGSHPPRGLPFLNLLLDD